MNKVFSFLRGVWDWLGNKPTPDQIIERNAARLGVPYEQPVWYQIVMRNVWLFTLGVGIGVTGILYWKYRSLEGVGTVTYLASALLSILVLPLRMIAAVQRKYRFSKALTPDLRVEYENAIKKRSREFVIILFYGLLGTGIFVGGLLYIDKITQGKGWF